MTIHENIRTDASYSYQLQSVNLEEMDRQGPGKYWDSKRLPSGHYHAWLLEVVWNVVVWCQENRVQWTENFEKVQGRIRDISWPIWIDSVQLFLLQRVKFINCFFFAIFQPFKSLLFNVKFEDIKLI